MRVWRDTIWSWGHKQRGYGGRGQEQWNVIRLTFWVHTFVTIGPILTILVPMESPQRAQLIGTKFVENGPILTK